MTTTYDVPKHVAENIAKRHAADTHATRCIYGCRAHARLYPCGARCDEHSPWALAGQPNPDSQVDPTRTADALRARMRTAPTAPTQSVPAMVRLLLDEHPEWADLFELRQRKAS